MNTLLEFGLTNAVLTAMLAILALSITRVWRNAHLAHALWLIVLVKLLVPPLVPLRLHLPAPVALGQIDGESPKPISAPSPIAELARAAPTNPVPHPWPDVQDHVAWDESPIELSGTMGGSGRSTVPPDTSERQRAGAGSWRSFLFPTTAITIAWLAGSVAWIVLATSRIVRFHRYLKDTRLAPDNIQREASTCALRLGLAGCPPIRLVEGFVPPMVWSAWRPIVLLPSQLLGQLAPRERMALIAHELAHIRRRDHWVRWLEMVVLAAYWWNPCAWWARRKLQVAEEQCCDGWVVWLFPDQARAYGSALLRTVEYLSQDGRPAPVLASGFGHVPMVKRRFEMIINKQIRPRMSSPMRVAVILAGVLVLPAAAQVADEDTPSGESAASEAALTPSPVAPQPRPESEPATASADAQPAEPASAAAGGAASAKAMAGMVLEERISRLEKMIEDLARIVESQSRPLYQRGPAYRGDMRGFGSGPATAAPPAPSAPAAAPRVPSPSVAAPPSPAPHLTPAEAFGRYARDFVRPSLPDESRAADAQPRRVRFDVLRHDQEMAAADDLKAALSALDKQQHQIKSAMAKTRLEMEKMQVELKYLEREFEDIEKEKQELQQRHREMSHDSVPRPDRR